MPEEPADEAPVGDESRGLRWTLYGVIGALIVILLLTLPSGAPLRDPDTGDIIGNSPFMDSLIFLITLVFLVAGICYGLGAGTIKSSVDVINAIQKTFAGAGGPRLHAAPDRPVHRLLQLQQHADGGRR